MRPARRQVPWRERLLYAAPLCAAAITLLLGVLLLDQQRRYARASREAAAQHARLEAIDRTYFHLREAESNQRGYLLTGDEAFREEYEAARIRVEAELPRLRETAGSAAELETVAVIERLARQRLAASRAVLRESEEEGAAAVAALVAHGEGRRAMAQLQDAVLQANAIHGALQREREAGLDRHFLLLLWVIAGGTGVASLAGVVSGVALSRHARERAETAERLEVVNVQLREQTEELELQRSTLEDQAVELEAQTLELELKTQELEETAGELTAREEQFRALVERASDMVLVLNADGLITYASPASARILGTAPDELSNRPLSSLVHEEDRAEATALLEGLAREPAGAQVIECRFVDAGGGARLLVGHARNLLEDAAVRGMVINCRDATHERAVEAQLRQAQKMEAVGQLAGGVAHDFNNVLTSIRGYAEFALDTLGEEHPARPDLQEVLKAADLASSLTRQLLSFSRRQVTRPEVLDLNTVVGDAVGLLRRLLGSSIELVTRFDPDLHPVNIDPGQVRQIIMNLAVNARDAMPEGGRLAIETANVVVHAEQAARRGVSTGDYVLLSVTDSGEGMTPDIVERIFEPFFTTKQQGEGTGLGLATVYGIAQQAGGYVWAYSEPGHGSTFKVYLPAALGARPVTGTTGGEQTWVPPADGAPVLLVEDDEAVRRFACRALERAGFQVEVAIDAAEALALLAREPAIRLVITDVVMPGMSGAALGREIAERYPHLRILYTSGYPRDEMAWRGSLPEDVAFIAKPYSSQELTQRAAELLGGGDVDVRR